MREFGKISSRGGRNKSERLKKAAEQYLKKSKALLKKIEEALKYDFKTQDELLLLIDLFKRLRKRLSEMGVCPYIYL